MHIWKNRIDDLQTSSHDSLQRSAMCAVQGVTVYVSDFQRSITDKFKNFFAEPSQVSELHPFMSTKLV